MAYFCYSGRSYSNSLDKPRICEVFLFLKFDVLLWGYNISKNQFNIPSALNMGATIE